MDLESVTLSEVSQRRGNHMIALICGILKKKKKIQMKLFQNRNTHRLREHFHGGRGDRLGLWDAHVQTATFKIDSQ